MALLLSVTLVIAGYGTRYRYCAATVVIAKLFISRFRMVRKSFGYDSVFLTTYESTESRYHVIVDQTGYMTAHGIGTYLFQRCNLAQWDSRIEKNQRFFKARTLRRGG